MKTAIYTLRIGRVAELADASVLGTDFERSAGSTPVSPTLERNLTVEATNTGIDSCVSLRNYETNKKLTKNFVAQDVALETECCKVVR